MRRSGPSWWVLLAAGALCLCLAGGAVAQEGGFQIETTADGAVLVTGSLTVDGTLYTAEDVEDLAALYVSDPAAVPILPDLVYGAVVQAAMAMQSSAAGEGTP